MCRILVVIDEYTAIYMDADAAKSINLLATIIATQARAAGIHLLIGNQQPYSDRVPKDVKGNISFILTGRQRTAGASMSTTGDTSARKLPKIPGRMLCDDGEDFYQVQIPHAREQDIYASLDAANNYPEPRELDLPEPDESIEATGQIFGIDDIIDLALKHFDGALKSRKIWALDECPASQNEVTRWIKEIASRDEIHHGEDVYRPVKKPGNYFVLEHVEPADSQIRSIEDGSIGESERETALETDLEAKYETKELEMIS
jgi:hypothetical protein